MKARTRISDLDAALEVHRWLETQKVSGEAGINWHTNATLPPALQSNIYYGGAGIALFYVGLFERTKDAIFLEMAAQAGDELIARLPAKLATQRRHDGSYADLKVDNQPGLYMGVGGIGFTLSEIHKVTKADRHRQGASRTIDLIAAAVETSEGGVAWNEVLDVVTGSAGIGLSLLYHAETNGDPTGRSLTLAAGRRLREQAIPDGAGLRWEWERQERLRHPNFAHGAAGTGYFLLGLHGLTGEPAFLDAALAGAAYLHGVAEPSGLICHSLDRTPDIFYLGWCHGPVGTGRFYYRLWVVTAQAVWLDRLFGAARAVMSTRFPHALPDGSWDNLGLCCGGAGIAEYFINLHIVALDADRSDAEEYLDFAGKLLAQIKARANCGDTGLNWTHSEHRTLPELRTTQAGYMQGAAGIASVLLYYDSVSRASSWRDRQAVAQSHIRLPDSPFFLEASPHRRGSDPHLSGPSQ